MSDSPQAPLLIWAGLCRMLARMSNAKSFHLEYLLDPENACPPAPPPLPYEIMTVCVFICFGLYFPQ